MLALTKVYFHKIDGNKKGLQRSEERGERGRLASCHKIGHENSPRLEHENIGTSGESNMKREQGDQSEQSEPSHANRGQEIKTNFTRVQIIPPTAQ